MGKLYVVTASKPCKCGHHIGLFTSDHKPLLFDESDEWAADAMAWLKGTPRLANKEEIDSGVLYERGKLRPCTRAPRAEAVREPLYAGRGRQSPPIETVPAV